MRICVYGVGATGGHVATRLAAAGGHKIRLLRETLTVGAALDYDLRAEVDVDRVGRSASKGSIASFFNHLPRHMRHH